MCTVTFVPGSSDGFFLTSNRDESPNRKTMAPEFYEIEGVKTLFPKDSLAGGTWLGVSDKNRLICLLNGGFKAHRTGRKYAISRGKIVTYLLAVDDVINVVRDIDLSEVEPFTIVWVSWENSLQLFELVWDGVQRHFSEKPLVPTIWSSSLLYDEKTKKYREKWFSEFLSSNINPTAEAVLNFHKFAGEGDLNIDLVMNRGFVKTKSITQIEKNDDLATFRYHDLETKSISNNQF